MRRQITLFSADELKQVLDEETYDKVIAFAKDFEDVKLGGVIFTCSEHTQHCIETAIDTIERSHSNY